MKITGTSSYVMLDIDGKKSGQKVKWSWVVSWLKQAL